VKKLDPCYCDDLNDEPQVAPEPDSTWRDHTDYARDFLRDADRHSADDLQAERARRLFYLEAAELEIAEAKRLLIAGAR
jgi:hypothetical protein